MTLSHEYIFQIIRKEFYLVEANKEFKIIYLRLKCFANVLNNSVQVV